MRPRTFRAAVVCLTVSALGVGTPAAIGASATRPHSRGTPAASAASKYPDIGCTLDLRQHPHFSTTGRKQRKSEVVWKVTVSCYWGKIVDGHFVSSGVRATVPFMHVRLALYRNHKQVGQQSEDRGSVSYLTVPVAGPCTAGAIYQGWGKAVAVLPPGVTDYHNGTRFSINQGWGNERRITECS